MSLKVLQTGIHKNVICGRIQCYGCLHIVRCRITYLSEVDSTQEGYKYFKSPIFSSPGRCPGRAIVQPPASALASALTAASALAKGLTLKFLCDGQGAVRRDILSL